MRVMLSILSVVLVGAAGAACSSSDSNGGAPPPAGDDASSDDAGGGGGVDSAGGKDAPGGADAADSGGNKPESGACNDTCPATKGGVTVGCETRFLYGVNYAWRHWAADFGGVKAWSSVGVSQDQAATLAELQDMQSHGVD